MLRVLIVLLFVSACSSIQAAGPSSEAHLRAVCPEGISEACVAKVLKGSKGFEMDEARRRFQALCEFDSKDSKFTNYRQLACFEQANIDAAQGRVAQAAEVRRKACALDMNFCVQFITQNYSPSFYEAVDLAGVICDRPEIKGSYADKLYFATLCSLPVNKTDRDAL